MERFEAKVERLQVETPDVTTIYFSVSEREFSYAAGVNQDRKSVV